MYILFNVQGEYPKLLIEVLYLNRGLFTRIQRLQDFTQKLMKILPTMFYKQRVITIVITFIKTYFHNLVDTYFSLHCTQALEKCTFLGLQNGICEVKRLWPCKVDLVFKIDKTVHGRLDLCGYYRIFTKNTWWRLSKYLVYFYTPGCMHYIYRIYL